MADDGRSYSLITLEKADGSGTDGAVPPAGPSTDAFGRCGYGAVKADPASIEGASRVDDSASADDRGVPADTAAASAPAELSSDERSESALDGITEDDLKVSAPLERVHKLIIALMVAGLVAFVVYLGVFA